MCNYSAALRLCMINLESIVYLQYFIGATHLPIEKHILTNGMFA
jgi:hypothetical protein